MTTTKSTAPTTAADKPNIRRIIVASSIGNTLGWYDFAVYGYMAVTLGNLFFPSDDPTASLLLSFAAFGAAFVVRPLGGAVFGPLGDKYGRRNILAFIVITMSVATFLIGLLPTYATIGVAAPVLLVMLRLIQGLTAGGEVSGATTYVAEASDPARRGFATSWIQMSATLGFFLGLAVPTALSLFISDGAMSDWGWRIPFLISGPLGVIGLFIRLRLEESPVFSDLAEDGKVASQPLVETFTKGWREMCLAGGLGIIVHLGYFMGLVYLPTYLTERLDFSQTQAFLATATVVAADVIAIPFFGALSDRVGRKPIMLAAATAFAVGVVPIYVIAQQSQASAFVALAALGALHGVYLGAVAASLAEVFLTRVRFGGFSIGHNVSAAIFGGGTPLLATWLGSKLDTNMVPAYLILIGALLCLFAVTRYTEMSGKPLDTAGHH